MKTRLGVARALLNDPQLIFMDEPTVGLDPASARRIRNLIRELKAAGRTVFLTTHDMTVADELCDRVAFIVGGEIRLVESPRAPEAGPRRADGRDGVRARRQPRAPRVPRSTGSAPTPISWLCCATPTSARCTRRKRPWRTSSCA